MNKRPLLLLLALAAAASAQTAGERRTAPNGMTVIDLAYVEGGHERHKLDLFLPEKADAPLPVIIWVHGGGWQAWQQGRTARRCAGYTRAGYAVASINYRLERACDLSGADRGLQGGDPLAARAREGYSLDPQRFGVWGSSAGGHLVALLGTSGEVKEFDVGANLDQSSRVQAVCDYFGPTDFSRFVTRGHERD